MFLDFVDLSSLLVIFVVFVKVELNLLSGKRFEIIIVEDIYVRCLLLRGGFGFFSKIN